MATAMISLRNVTKVFGGDGAGAVQELTMDVPEGETVVLVGPSGCGKTTTMKMINRLIDPSSGTIEVNGTDIMQQDPVKLRRGIGYVIQSIGLLPHRTVAQNIATVPKLLGWDASRVASRIDELIEMLHLDPAFLDRYPSVLSGGQRQRVGVARALAADPPLMLMDEPFGAVDPIVRTRLQDQFLEIQRQLRKTIVFVTHDIDEAMYLSDRIVVLTHSPTEVEEVIRVDLPRPRDQIETKELSEFAHLRAHVYRLIKRERGESAAADEGVVVPIGGTDV